MSRHPTEPKDLPPFRIGDDKRELPQIAHPEMGMIITGPLHPFSKVPAPSYVFTFQTPSLIESGRHAGDRGICTVYVQKSIRYLGKELDPFSGPNLYRMLVCSPPTRASGTVQHYECRAIPLRQLEEASQGIPGADLPNILTRNQVVYMIERALGQHPERDYSNSNPVAQKDDEYFEKLKGAHCERGEILLFKELSDFIRTGKMPQHIRSFETTRNRRRRG